jgi:hypothetical protein
MRIFSSDLAWQKITLHQVSPAKFSIFVPIIQFTVKNEKNPSG